MRHVTTLTRYLGAAALLAVGAEHLDQFTTAHYDAIPTIGTLFALNFAGATILALGLAAPLHRLGRRAGPVLVDALALGGIALAGSSLIGLLISERTALFGFMETGYRGAIVLSIGLEVATILLLAAYLALPRPSPPTTLDLHVSRPAAPPPLHEVEAEVMEAVWNRGEASIREVMDDLNAGPGKDRAYTTFMTVMARLDRKGLLSRRREGKTDLTAGRHPRPVRRPPRPGRGGLCLVQQFADVAVYFAAALADLDPNGPGALQRLDERQRVRAAPSACSSASRPRPARHGRGGRRRPRGGDRQACGEIASLSPAYGHDPAPRTPPRAWAPSLVLLGRRPRSLSAVVQVCWQVRRGSCSCPR